jgi:hypothetical protein
MNVGPDTDACSHRKSWPEPSNGGLKLVNISGADRRQLQERTAGCNFGLCCESVSCGYGYNACSRDQLVCGLGGMV